MLDLGTYCVISQSFEYLVGLGTDGNIADTGLAESWEPNADGSPGATITVQADQAVSCLMISRPA